ncbi:MAG: family 78 glycoside hydrolase catalytic domain, partial [Clostridiales bacterium]|nr:family 78 glycoside hydrolase catalytic domain [Clostridiales bacterium]
MKHRFSKRLAALALSAVLLSSTFASGFSASAETATGSADIVNLKVANLTEPLAVEDATPAFSWAMQSNVIGAAQSAYQIVVTDAKGNVVWDSGKVASNAAQATYDGQELKADSNYTWSLKVWDQNGNLADEETARFATGLMNPSQSAWDGAQFIGSTDIYYDAAYQHNGRAEIGFTIESGDNFSFIFGADDFRFAETAMNPFNTPGGENFIRVEIDTSDITEDSNPGARFAIYRVGYDQTDDINGDPNVYPYKWGRLDPSVITYENKNEAHSISVALNYSTVTLQVDGKALPTTAYEGELATTRDAIGTPIDENTEKPAGLEDATILRRPGAKGRSGFDSNVTPNLTYPEDTSAALGANTGGNHNTYPNMNSIGFQVNNVGDKVVINNIVINERNNTTSRVFFSDTVGATYDIFADAAGVSVDGSAITVTGTEENARTPIYRDPSYGSMTYARTEFTTNKDVADAKLYATAMGGYEMYINGEAVSNDWFNPGLTQYREYLNYNAYDVTDMVKSNGKNAMAAKVGVGFYAGYMANTNYNTWTDNLGVMAKLVINYTDGSSETVVTKPETWQVCTTGPATFTDIYGGYAYDANNEKYIAGWTEADFADPYGVWYTPEIIKSKHPATGDYTWENVRIIARADQPVRVANTRTATRVLDTHFSNGEGVTYTYDMGTAMTGVPSITIPAGSLKEGDRVVIRSAETIYPGNSDSKDFDGNTVEYHNYLGVADYKYEDLYGPNGGYRKNAAGKLFWDTNRGALASDLYIASKEDETRDVVIQPTDTFHGYRFISISIPHRAEPLPLEDVKGLELSSIAKPVNYLNATTTDTSEQYPEGRTAALHEQFFKNTLQSQFGNFISIPTDCPQRNERQGWTGDLQLYSRTATYHSLDTQNFLRQWMKAVSADLTVNGAMGNTSPAYGFTKPGGSDSSIVWGGAMVQAPWQLYSQYGDTEVVADNYEAIKLYINNDKARPFTAADSQYPGLTTANGLSDHIGLEGSTSGGNGSCLLQNVLLMHLIRSTAVMADEMGDTEYAASLRERFTAMQESWNRCFVEAETGMTLNRNPATGALTETNNTNNPEAGSNVYLDTQSTYAYALYYDVVSDTMTITEGENKGMTYKDFFAKRLAQLIADPSQTGNGKGPRPNSAFLLASGGPYTSSGRPYTITTGFAATPSILPALTKTGSNEAAYEIFSNTDYATWLYPVQLGATTQWELWDGYDRAMMWAGQSGMNSFNHFALGSSVEWVYEYQMGITSGDEAGYQNFVLQPNAGGNYTSLAGGYESTYGMINVEWTAKGNGSVDDEGQTIQANEMTGYGVTVPANTNATLYLPVEAKDAVINTTGVTYTGEDIHDGQVCAKFELAAGGYDFAIEDGVITVNVKDGYVDDSSVVKSATAPESAQVGADFDVTVVTAASVADVRLFNANGLAIGRKAVNVADNEDGTKTWTITTALGTVGDARELKVVTKDASGILTDSGVS